MSVKIKALGTKKELKTFIKFNLELSKNNAFVAPPLIADELLTLQQDKNPAFDFCEAAYFLAYK